MADYNVIIPAVAGCIGAGITAWAGRPSRAERREVAEVARLAPPSPAGNGRNGTLMHEVLADRARAEREHASTVETLREAYEGDLRDRDRTVRIVRDRLDVCEADRSRLLRRLAESGHPGDDRARDDD